LASLRDVALNVRVGVRLRQSWPRGVPAPACLRTVTSTRLALIDLEYLAEIAQIQGMLKRLQLLTRLPLRPKDGSCGGVCWVLVSAQDYSRAQLAEGSKSTYFDLENPVDLARLSQPLTALESLRGLIVIDEVQRRPDLFPILRYCWIASRLRARF